MENYLPKTMDFYLPKSMDFSLPFTTDYVFDGLSVEPQSEDKETRPINYYGYTKEQGEKIVRKLLDKYFIIRTSWLYGSNGKNFVETILELDRTNNEINVVMDQIGSPTYSKDLAVLVCDMIQTTKYGIYHGVNEGYCSWYEFAKVILQKINMNSFEDAGVKVKPITSEEYPTKAKRPLNSRLSKNNLDKSDFKRLPYWDDGLDRYLKEIFKLYN